MTQHCSVVPEKAFSHGATRLWDGVGVEGWLEESPSDAPPFFHLVLFVGG